MLSIHRIRATATLAGIWSVAWAAAGAMFGYLRWSALIAQYPDNAPLNFSLSGNVLSTAIASALIGALAGACFSWAVLLSEKRGRGMREHPIAGALMTATLVAIGYGVALQSLAALFNPWLFPMYQLLQGALTFGALAGVSAGVTLAIAGRRAARALPPPVEHSLLADPPMWEEMGVSTRERTVERQRGPSTA